RYVNTLMCVLTVDGRKTRLLCEGAVPTTAQCEVPVDGDDNGASPRIRPDRDINRVPRRCLADRAIDSQTRRRRNRARVGVGSAKRDVPGCRSKSFALNDECEDDRGYEDNTESGTMTGAPANEAAK